MIKLARKLPLAGRYSNGAPNIEWFLKATSGERLSTDRIARGYSEALDPALSAACCIQPGRLVELGSVKAFRESGLLARWLYAVPSSRVGSRTGTTPIPAEILTLWEQRITGLAEAGMVSRKDAPPVKMTLAIDARAALKEFRSKIEPHLHPDHGKYAGIADWALKLPGAAVRIAAALALIENPDLTEIDEGTMTDAISIATAYVSHAIAAFGLTRPNAEVQSQAKQVLGAIRKMCADSAKETVTHRDVHRKLGDRAWVTSSDSLDPPVEILLDRGHVRRLSPPQGKPGRPAAQYELHPSYRPGPDGQPPDNGRRNGQNQAGREPAGQPSEPHVTPDPRDQAPLGGSDDSTEELPYDWDNDAALLAGYDRGHGSDMS